MSFIIPEFTTSIIDSGFTPEDEDTKKLYKEVEAFAKQGQPVVIFGPAGAGKEFLARHYYNTFVKSGSYKQCKTNWESKYNEIKRHYSDCYSGKSLEVYLSSLKPGIFHSVNSAKIYPYLAETFLFGHEENPLTGISVKPGLLELIKGGVLFIEEIGELTKDVQAKLLRAFNSEISEGCRMSGKMNYSLRDVIIILATNQQQDTIRSTFYYKMGMQVSIKGIDERPEDIRKSIPYFIGKAIDKRKDCSAISSMFMISDHVKTEVLSETKEIKNFAKEQSDLVADEILMRKWTGNFRALRTALEASILRIETPKAADSFSEEFRKNLKYYIPQYSDDTSKTYTLVEKSSPGTLYPSRFPDMERKIIGRIISKRSFQDVSDFEKKILALFLSSTHETGFMRRDLEEHYKAYHDIKHTSEAHIRNKINKLLSIKIISKTGEGKSTRYSLTNAFLNQLKNEDIFSLPDISNDWADRNIEIEDLGKRLLSIWRIYIEAGAGYGKTAFIAMFCDSMQRQYNFYYYALGGSGINKFLEDIFKLLQSKKDSLDRDKFLKDAVNNIQPYLEEIFRAKNGRKPILILDNAHFVSGHDDMAIIENLAKNWNEVILILIGEKMDNKFLENFAEFPLGPWGTQA